MALVITLNVILAFAVIVMVISPLVWAILTQHRDAPEVRPYRRRGPRATVEASPGTRRPLYEQVAEPLRPS